MVNFSSKFYFWRPMKLPIFAIPIPSVRLSVTSRSTVKTVRDRPMVTIESL